MTTERVYRVAYVETNRDIEDVRYTFAQCGKICGIYPFKTGDRQKSVHFFVEFDEQHSVKRARALQLRDVKVHVLAYSPELVQQFILVAPGATPTVSYQPMEPHEHCARPWAPDKPYSPASSYAARKQRRKGAHKDLAAYQNHGSMRSDNAFVLGSSGEHNKENNSGISLSGTPGPCLLTPPLSMDGLPSVSTHGTPVKAVNVKTESLPSSPVRQGPPTPAKVNLPPRPTSPAHITPSPAIVLNYGNTPFHCRLDQLSDDPQNIITLLSQTCAQALERDKWMIVAAYYRNKGNTQAALAVVAAMVNVLTSSPVRLPEAELKPAYLMMAGCHSDLSKTASAEDVKAHMVKAQECLQKVYGTNVPSLGAVSQKRDRDGRNRLAANSNNSAVHAQPRGKDNRTVSQPRLSSADESRLRILEREVQSLRDRLRNATVNLATARGAKDQLEDEVSSERETRHKLERELADAMEELDGARKGERYALEQCRREVDSRRRIEERAVELRDETASLRREIDVKDREIVERERKMKETFGRFGELFIRVSRGETDSTTVWTRSVSSMAPPASTTPRRSRTTSAHSPSKDRSAYVA
ncbi:hypothetical protein EIP86_001338 [Pleurotus ostreatoroseus]|nr:hypothetical protein EIP86_001338 [Pleurotus ostreatoroseus]